MIQFLEKVYFQIVSESCKITNCDFTRTELYETTFTNCNFEKIDFPESYIDACKFEMTTFSKSNLDCGRKCKNKT